MERERISEGISERRRCRGKKRTPFLLTSQSLYLPYSTLFSHIPSNNPIKHTHIHTYHHHQRLISRSHLFTFSTFESLMKSSFLPAFSSLSFTFPCTPKLFHTVFQPVFQPEKQCLPFHPSMKNDVKFSYSMLSVA
jgi:hypothetical protein